MKEHDLNCSVEEPHTASFLNPIIGINIWWTSEKWRRPTLTAVWMAYRGEKCRTPNIEHGPAFDEYVSGIDENDEEIINYGIPYHKVREFVANITASHQRLVEKGIYNKNGFPTHGIRLPGAPK